MSVRFPGTVSAITATAPRTLRYILAGASQHSRCSTEEKVVSAQVLAGVCTVTVSRDFVWANGLEAYCTIPGAQVFGPITVTGARTLTIPAPGYPDTAVLNGDTDTMIHVTGAHAAASWAGRLESYYGQAMTCVGNLSKHGDRVSEVEVRMPSILAAIRAKKPHAVFFEAGIGNSLNSQQDVTNYFPRAQQLIKTMAAAVPLVVMTNMPGPAPGSSNTSDQIKVFHQLNQWLMVYLPRLYSNVIVIDVNSAVMDFTASQPVTVANVHSDDLHWKPLGAVKVAEAYTAVFDKFLTFRSPMRMGASHVWANGNRQLFDGLLDNSGSAPGVSNISGTLDNTMTISKIGAGSSLCACSKVLLSNGLYGQQFAYTSLSATAAFLPAIKGVTGATIASRLVPGRRYRFAVLASIFGITGTINTIEFLAQITLAGVANNTGPRICWTGRSQQGYVESNAGAGTNNFNQTADELDRCYVGADYTVPAEATSVTAFEITNIVNSGAAGSAVTVLIKDVLIEDVTDYYNA